MIDQYLFTYGTLAKESVQQKLFNRTLSGTSDELVGYSSSEIKLPRNKVQSIYPVIEYTGNDKDKVEGVVFKVSLEEILIADNYEGVFYKRKKVTLKSGQESWAYVKS
ncbi:gamma-glutamylcyclotransferase family protein [Leeuwenhoekiella sp. A16]|uniref:gamma-glutamylcyclotransferase family protein n=1 Tax=unclassified Leeuwenhoekiella TaxID=2615029 RepID=UPI003A7F8C21